MIKRPFSNKLFFASMIVVWSLAVFGGFYQLWDYSNGPGIPGGPPKIWPNESKLQREDGKPTLLVFAHPRCPCTRASFRELERILSHINEKVSTHIVFYRPKKFPVDWVKAKLWETSQKMPIRSVSIDSEGKEIHLFRPQTSGQVSLNISERWKKDELLPPKVELAIIVDEFQKDTI